MISLFRGNKRVRTTSSSSKKKKQKSPQEKRRMDFLSPVLKLIGTLLLNEYARITGISDKLKAWQDMLPTIQLYLDSADERMMLGDTATATWLSDLRDVTYDMEDLLEEFSAEAKREAPKLQALSKRTRLPQRLIACCSRFSPPTLISDHHMANQIEEVGRRLYGINSRIDMLKLVQNPTSKPTNDWPHFITTSEPEPNFVGRGEEIKELLVRLTGSEATYDSSRPFNVVSILGMSGLGKTTLAQELYKKAGFEHKAWACVSDVFDKAAITKSILDHFQPSLSSVGMDLNQLQTSLREKLSGKKFLIVLDDVWNDDYNDLESLVRPLYSGSKGSRILLTTRNLEVTKSVGDPHPMRLDLLPLEDCVSLLAYHSLDKKNFEQHPLLRDSAVQLAEKCKRLPLSIKTIGRLLRFKTGKKEWDRLLTHSIWSKEGKIPSALKLSYLHLPIHLRRCFAACAVFPKDYMFDQDEVIRMWIIHGLLQKGTSQTYRQVGMEYLLQLEAVSLFQKVRDEEGSYYSMHNLVNDLAKSIDDCSYYSSDEYKDGSGCHGKSLGRVRHASIVTQSYESLHSKRFDVYRQMKKLRTFSAFQISTFRESTVYVSGEVICELTMNMKNLRMLSLSCFRVSDLPDRIGELKLLRCIDLSHTTIEVLPESICDLVELQSLLLRECHKLKELPENIYRLTKLLHLDITGPNRLREMPPRIGDLINLEILSDFVVGKEVGRDLKQLGPLKCLQRGLKISNLLAVDDIKDASVANLPGKEGVLDLSLDWGSYSGVSRENDHQFELLQHLQPSENIESLNISEYGGKRFSSWFDNPLSLKYVVRITLAYCRSVDSLPPLGKLPSLESLDISGLDSLSSIGAEFYGTEKPYFPKLRSLSFTTMKSWKKWLFHGENENDQPFPCLRQLQVFHCPKLKGGCSLRLPSLVEIDIDGCNGEMLNCLAGLTSMTKMEIENIPHLVHFDRRFQTSWVSLEEMTINNCPQFKSFVDGDGEEQLPPKLKKLEMIDCGDIVKLPDDLSGLTSLKEMSIFHCYKLSSFPSEGLPVSLRKLMLYDCHNLPQSLFELLGSLEELTLWDLKGLVSIRDIAPKGSPVSQSLRELNIEDCTSLMTLTDSLQYLSALSDLSLIDCPELEMDIFPTLPYNLSSFWLYKCPKVKSLPQDMYRLTSLKQLSIGGCEGITSFPNLPCSLSSFKLDSCPNVNYLPQDMHRVTSLKKLSIRDCQGITRFPDLPCNLSSFKLDSCPNVNNLPQDMHSLLSLKKLSIRYCEGITSLPRGGLPPNMESLVIWSCRNLNQPIGEWGLRDLTALRELKIMGRMEWMDEMEVFPPPRSGADWSGILPSSLLKLTIGEMEKLEKVGGGLRHHLTSLKYLGIYSCERMRWLPEDGLPDTLEHLGIFRCSLLREKCRKGEGEYWHSHLRLIPQIEFS